MDKTLRCADQIILEIDRSIPFNPGILWEGFTVWRGPPDGDGLKGEEGHDERSLSLTKINLGYVAPAGLTGDRELDGGSDPTELDWIDSLQDDDGLVPLDGGVGMAILSDGYGIGMLEHLFNTSGTTEVDLPGTILRDRFGNQFIATIERMGEGVWCWGAPRWLGHPRYERDSSLVLEVRLAG